MFPKADDHADSQVIGNLINDLERQRFFGSLELKLEAGHVVLIRKTETIKPTSDYRDNRGTGNGQSS